MSPAGKGTCIFGFDELRHTSPLNEHPRASPWPNPRRTADESNRNLVAILSCRRFSISVTGSAFGKGEGSGGGKHTFDEV